jgi:hypothetical protein
MYLSRTTRTVGSPLASFSSLLCANTGVDSKTITAMKIPVANKQSLRSFT